MSQSQTFWSLVYGALQDATLSRLCRAYDQDDDALTLRTLLETIQLRPGFLPGTLVPIDEVQLNVDLEYVNQDKNQVVKHLMMWRHKFYAHRDAAKIVSGRTLGHQYPITYDDVASLLETGSQIVNRYSIAFFSTSSLPMIIGANDYLMVLETLQQEVKRHEVRLEEETNRSLGQAQEQSLKRVAVWLRSLWGRVWGWVLSRREAKS